MDYQNAQFAVARIYTSYILSSMQTTVFKSGNSLAVRLPKGYELPQGKVALRKEGGRIIIEKLEDDWPEHFFEDVRIERPDFGREKPAYREKRL